MATGTPLGRAQVTLLAGREGTGKSMLALALARAQGNGSMVAGMDATEPARVLYVDAENGEGEIHRRVHGLQVRPEGLDYMEAPCGFDLNTQMKDLKKAVGDYRPAVVVLDSLRSLAPSWRENDSDAAEALIGPLRGLARQHNCAVLILHHAGKGEGGREYRGSSGLGAAVEIGFTLGRAEGDRDRTRRRLSCGKMHPAAEPEPRWLSLAANWGVLSISEAEPFDQAADGPPSQVDHAADRKVGALIETGEPMTLRALCAAVRVDPESGTAKRAIKDRRIERVARGVYRLSLEGA